MPAYQSDNTLLKLIRITLEELGCRYISRNTTKYPTIEVHLSHKGRASTVSFNAKLDDGIICKRIKEEVQTQQLLGEI